MSPGAIYVIPMVVLVHHLASVRVEQLQTVAKHGFPRVADVHDDHSLYMRKTAKIFLDFVVRFSQASCIHYLNDHVAARVPGILQRHRHGRTGYYVGCAE